MPTVRATALAIALLGAALLSLPSRAHAGNSFFDGFAFFSLAGGGALPLVDSDWRDAATTFHRTLAIRTGFGIGGDGNAVQLEADLVMSKPSEDLSRYRGLFGMRLELMATERLLTVARIAAGFDTVQTEVSRDTGMTLELGGGLWAHLGSNFYVGLEVNLPLSSHIFEDDAPADGLIDLELLGGLMFRETF